MNESIDRGAEGSTDPSVFAALPTGALAASPGEEIIGPFQVDPDASISRRAFIGWLAIEHEAINKRVEDLRSHRPNLLTHPVQRFRWVGEVAIEVGKRRILNKLADYVTGHSSKEDQ